MSTTVELKSYVNTKENGITGVKHLTPFICHGGGKDGIVAILVGKEILWINHPSNSYHLGWDHVELVQHEYTFVRYLTTEEIIVVYGEKENGNLSLGLHK